jgi:hypothetical protein
VKKSAPASLGTFPSFPRKRESRDFEHWPWVPAFAGTTILDGRQGFFTASAGTANSAVQKC